jgi:hypothetical protein
VGQREKEEVVYWIAISVPHFGVPKRGRVIATASHSHTHSQGGVGWEGDTRASKGSAAEQFQIDTQTAQILFNVFR